MPHWHRDRAIFWVTFRLADSVPSDLIGAWREARALWMRAHPEPWTETEWEEYDERYGQTIDAWLDAGLGSRPLARPDVRAVVKDCLLRFDGERLRVHAAVLMPTHVHALLEPLPKVGQAFLPVPRPNDGQAGMPVLPCWDLSALLRGIKGASARKANALLGTAGSFWQDESYDHIVRNERQYQRFRKYLQDNPAKASLPEGDYWLHAPDAP